MALEECPMELPGSHFGIEPLLDKRDLFCTECWWTSNTISHGNFNMITCINTLSKRYVGFQLSATTQRFWAMEIYSKSYIHTLERSCVYFDYSWFADQLKNCKVLLDKYLSHIVKQAWYILNLAVSGEDDNSYENMKQMFRPERE